MGAPAGSAGRAAAGLGVEGLVVLHEVGVGGRAGEGLAAPGLGEPTARIAMAAGRDKQDLGNRQRRDRRHGRSRYEWDRRPDGAGRGERQAFFAARERRGGGLRERSPTLEAPSGSVRAPDDRRLQGADPGGQRLARSFGPGGGGRRPFDPADRDRREPRLLRRGQPGRTGRTGAVARAAQSRRLRADRLAGTPAGRGRRQPGREVLHLAPADGRPVAAGWSGGRDVAGGLPVRGGRPRSGRGWTGLRVLRLRRSDGDRAGAVPGLGGLDENALLLRGRASATGCSSSASGPCWSPNTRWCAMWKPASTGGRREFAVAYGTGAGGLREGHAGPAVLADAAATSSERRRSSRATRRAANWGRRCAGCWRTGHPGGDRGAPRGESRPAQPASGRSPAL